ncbi:MAG: sigma-70 domain-containing protein [Dysosmobacter sp.]
MIVDLARKQDWLPRQVRQKVTRLNRAVDELSAKLGRAPESHEVADYLGLTREQYDALLSETAVSSLVSFEAVLDSCGSATEAPGPGGDSTIPRGGVPGPGIPPGAGRDGRPAGERADGALALL